MMVRPSHLALAGFLVVPCAHSVEYKFHGDFDVRGFDRSIATGGNESGFEQRLRLRADILIQDRMSVHAGVNLINDTWRGDASGDLNDLPQTKPFTDGRDHRAVTLDYGYVSLPLGEKFQVRAGRQIANWNFGLTVADDRRDRIILMGPVAEDVTFLAGADQRRNVYIDETEDDGYLFYAGLTGRKNGWSWGTLLGHYLGFDEKNDVGIYESNRFYNVRGATLFSPWGQGKVGEVEVTAGGHYLGGGEALYTNNTYTGFVRGGLDINPTVKLEAQYFFNINGSLVEPGFDSFSSLIHSSPRHDATATKIAALSMGGLGTGAKEFEGVRQDFDRHLIAMRGTYRPNDKWQLKLAAGWVQYDGLVRDLSQSEDVVFGDIQVQYNFTESTRLWATYGFADTSDLLPGRDNVSAVSLNLQMRF